MKKLFDLIDDDIDWEESEYRMNRTRKMAALFMQDMMNKEKGGVAPDTKGADYFFLGGFITEEMSWDFAAIEQDFLSHCGGRLRELSAAGWYGDEAYWTETPIEAIQKKMFRLMYNGAKLQDDYCLRLIRYLYKIYHKREYNQLKRFRTINCMEVMSLSEKETGGNSLDVMGRILGMSQFMNIELDDSCSILFLYLENVRSDWEKEDDDIRIGDLCDKDLFQECMRQVEDWCKDLNIRDRHTYLKKYRAYDEYDSFVEACLKQRGYCEDYAFSCMENYMGRTIQMASTLSVLRKMNPNKEYTFEEVQRYTVIYSLVDALADSSDTFNLELDYLTGEQIPEYDEDETVFRAEALESNNKNTVVRKEAESKIPVNIAPVNKGKVSEDEFLAEIASLRSRLHEKEQENKSLRELYRQSKKTQDEKDKILQKVNADRRELIALRDFAYRTEFEPMEIAEQSIEDMKQEISDRSIVIIGGHINWVNKLKKEFPGWMFILTDAYKTVDGRMLENKERVYFFTNYISHVTYGKFIDAVRERKIPFGYIGTNNVEQIIRQIYDDIGKGER